MRFQHHWFVKCKHYCNSWFEVYLKIWTGVYRQCSFPFSHEWQLKTAETVQNGNKFYWPMAMWDRWPLKTFKVQRKNERRGGLKLATQGKWALNRGGLNRRCNCISSVTCTISFHSYCPTVMYHRKKRYLKIFFRINKHSTDCGGCHMF